MEIFKTWLDVVPANLLQLTMLKQGNGTKWSQKMPFSLNNSVILLIGSSLWRRWIDKAYIKTELWSEQGQSVHAKKHLCTKSNLIFLDLACANFCSSQWKESFLQRQFRVENYCWEFWLPSRRSPSLMWPEGPLRKQVLREISKFLVVIQQPKVSGFFSNCFRLNC